MSGAALLCTPLVLTILLLLAVKWPKMDAVTLHMPMRVRASLSQVITEGATFSRDDYPVVRRAIRLNPENPSAWHHLCGMFDASDPELTPMEACRMDVKLNDSDAFAHRNLGELQLHRTPCIAEQSYARAVALDASISEFKRNLGLARLRCGHMATAKEAIDAAYEQDMKDQEDSSSGSNSGTYLDLDHELRAVFFSMQHEDQKALVECRFVIADPSLSCTCALNNEDRYGCSGTSSTTSK